MKKIISLLIASIIIFTLCGCEKYSDYKEIESRFFVYALGIDETSGGITIFAEGSVSDNENTVAMLTGNADTIPKALDNIRNSTPLTLDLSHCAVIVIGKRKEGTERKLCEYLLSKPDDMLSCYFVSCDSAKDLISCKSDKTIGQSLAYALKKNNYLGGKRTPSTLLDILNSPEAYYLPHFTVYENSYVYNGATYYNGLRNICTKDTDEARLITLLSGEFSRGKITVQNQTIDIKSTSFSQTCTNDNIKLTLTVDVNGDIDSVALENRLLKIFKEWQEDYKVNIFKFCDNGKKLSSENFTSKNLDLTLKFKQSKS